MKQKTFFIIFKRISDVRNCLRPESGPLRKFLYELPHEFLNDLRLSFFRNKEILGHCMKTPHSDSLPCRNKFLPLALRKYAKTGIKVFLTLLDSLIFLKIFCTGFRISRDRSSHQTCSRNKIFS